MEKKSDFFRKPGMLFVLVSLLVFAGLGAAFGEGMQNREAYAARTEVAAEFSGTTEETGEPKISQGPKRRPAEFCEVYGIQPVQKEAAGSLLKAAVYRVVGKHKQPKTVLFEELTTEALAKDAMETVEQETLQLMSSPAGTSWGGMIKAYAGKTPILITEDDKEVLLRIVEAEATSEDVKGRMLVANVVLNRVLSKGFPDSIAEVVFQKNGNVYQFSPIKDGRYWKVTVSDKTREAVERVLSGEDESQGALFFMARRMANENAVRWFDNALEYLFQYGVHEFYKNK